jgi:hypothetical protein
MWMFRHPSSVNPEEPAQHHQPVGLEAWTDRANGRADTSSSLASFGFSARRLPDAG